MGRSKKTKAPHGDSDLSDSVSELSHDSSLSNTSKSSSIRIKFGRFGNKKKGSEGSVSSSSRGAGAGQPMKSERDAPVPQTRSDIPVRTESSSQIPDQKRLIKDAKSRYNIGIVYLKTGDYAKAQENLEHSLFCHVQTSGHDSRTYTNEAIFAIAGVREKLGDCFVANTAVVDKYLASDHYEESRRLLKSVASEDAPDNLKEMLERVDEKLKQPELQDGGPRRKVPSYRQPIVEGKLASKVGVGDGVTSSAAMHSSSAQKDKKVKRKRKVTMLGLENSLLGKVAQNVADGIHEVAEGIHDLIDNSDDSDDDASRRSYLSEEADWFETAMTHLERDNHRTAFNYLTSLQEGGSMKNSNFRRQMADSLLKVAASSLDAGKISVASDAYEGSHAVLKQGKNAGDKTKLAAKGCIKCHKLLAKKAEGIDDYSSAISHRIRVYQLLDEDNRTVPACQQQFKIAYLYGAKEDYANSAMVLSEAISRLRKGVQSVDKLANDGRDLLIQCYLMQAICHAKSKKLNVALEQYDEVLPLIFKKEGQGSKQYNSALIHKSALLVTMGNHRLAASTIVKYLETERFSQNKSGSMIVDDLDYILALDTSAATHLKLGDVDKATSIFERKLEFVRTLPNNQEMKSDTMHKLGCLLAHKSKPKKALKMLDEALSTKKIVFDGKHKSVLETTWAVAATSQTLGDSGKALKEYSVLMDKMALVDDMPVDTVVVHHSAGKLFFEDGKADKAVQSFRQALDAAEFSGNAQLKSEITLNLANALSAMGELDEAMELYGTLLNTKSLKKTKVLFLTRFNRSLSLIKMGEVEEARDILHKIAENRSPMADDLKGNIYLTLGNLAISDGNADEALGYFEKSLDLAEEDDVSALSHTKKSMAMAHLEAGRSGEAISTLEDVLEDLSYSDGKGKSLSLLKAEIWNCLARVYKMEEDLPQAKNFAKLALQTYKAELGETNPITLRNVSNLQLLLLEEAEDLEKLEAKSVIDAAKFELEETLEAFVSLDDPWTYRLDLASLNTNLGFVAVWQKKPKKARKLVDQINEIEIPPEHSLLHRITVLEECVEKLEKKGGSIDAAIDKTPRRSRDESQSSIKSSKPKRKRKKKHR